MKEKVKVFQLLKLTDFSDNEHILFGTINDIRTWAKNTWKDNSVLAMKRTGAKNEEDFYLLMDGDVTLSNYLQTSRVSVQLICSVPLDDFYNGKKAPQELIDEVLNQIKVDIAEGDVTALDELLKAVSVKKLKAFLPEKTLKNNS